MFSDNHFILSKIRLNISKVLFPAQLREVTLDAAGAAHTVEGVILHVQGEGVAILMIAAAAEGTV